MHDHTILKFEEFFAYIRNTNSRNHIRKNCKKQWINLRNRVGNSLRCNVTSSAPSGPEVRNFTTRRRKIKITPSCTLTALHIAIQAIGLATSDHKGSNSIFQSEHRRSPLRFVTFSSLSQYRLMLQLNKDRSPPHPLQCFIHYHLIKRNCKQNRR